jgi:competence protein ComFC
MKTNLRQHISQSLTKKLRESVNSLAHFIYPEICLICENELSETQKHICSFCQLEFHFTYFESYIEPSPMDKLFWGRVALRGTYALLEYKKGQSVQPLLHSLKYKNRPQLGIQLGKEIAARIKDHPSFQEIDALIPVPLHPKKEFIRGYNQSEKLAQGIAEVLNVSLHSNFLNRTKHTQSQTNKNRFKRWDNVQNKFAIDLTNRRPLKHIALIDDVVTTGSTLESLVKTINTYDPSIQVSVITLAIAL